MKYFLTALAFLAATAQAQDNAWTYDKWSPPAALENPCSTELHNSYSAIGEDGLRYPTWHPATDPSGCHYGHSHGFEDPAQSPLYAMMGPPLFGYAAEQMSKQDVMMHRHESHEGYKVSWGHRDYIPTKVLGIASGPILQCDLMSIIHMGTFNADAFTNNQHEQHFRTYCISADTGEVITRDHVKLMTIAGKPGGFTPTCGATTAFLTVGDPVPMDSPTTNPLAVASSMGIKRIPTSVCMIKARPSGGQDMLEVWQTASGLRGVGGSIVFQAHWYWFAHTMSRFYDLRTLAMGKSLNTCYEKNVDGTFVVTNNPCLTVRTTMPEGPFTGVVCNAANPFDGDTVTIRLTTLKKNNPTEFDVFYTDVHGQNPSAEYFLGSVKQEVSKGFLPAKNNTYTSTAQTIGGKDADAFLCDQN